jgi:hypothetical protein
MLTVPQYPRPYLDLVNQLAANPLAIRARAPQRWAELGGRKRLILILVTALLSGDGLSKTKLETALPKYMTTV